MKQTSLDGAHYLSKGYNLIWQPEIRKYVIVPLLINIITLAVATYYTLQYIADWYQSLHSSDSSIIIWIVENLDWLLWPLLVLSVFLVVFFLFAFLANWIAAPFNGLLSEAVERHLEQVNGLNQKKYSPEKFKLADFMSEIPRLISREWRKFIYYAPRAIGCLILFFTPLAIIAPFIWFFFNAWMSAIQYIDYPMDNHKVPFNEMLTSIKRKKSASMSFGILVMLLTMIPLINIFIMPIAVAGATNLWFDHYRK